MTLPRTSGTGPTRLPLLGLALLGACALVLTACSPARDTTVATAATGSPALHRPQTTTAADWKPVADALGRTGTLQNRTVYRVALPRKDLHVTSQGVTINPGFALGGYAAFARYDDGTMVMGDLVVTEDELPKVTDALQAARIEQTAVHKHLLQQSPAIWWTHIHAMGDPATLARGVKAALAVTGIPPAAAPAAGPPINLDTAAIDRALGRKGTADAGIYKFTIARKETIVADQHVLPAALGLTTAVNFQPLGGNDQAAINGDFVMTAHEIQPVIQALRRGGIDIVELHNHSLDEQPRLFYMHFWATGDATHLAQGLRPALDATNLVS
jgi:Domain of Unknown Function (DUF1259)